MAYRDNQRSFMRMLILTTMLPPPNAHRQPWEYSLAHVNSKIPHCVVCETIVTDPSLTFAAFRLYGAATWINLRNGQIVDGPFS
jgi:hypothetical protein